jgi:TatA/E family protein of Tat protein translocase
MLADIFGPDLLVVAIILVVLLFGAAAIPKLARNLGSAKKEFEKGQSNVTVPDPPSDATEPTKTPTAVIIPLASELPQRD